ncbi:MAG TPA: AAA family ATPase [Longimicrobium sp.]
MRANPGGQIAPSEVIGRGPLINRLWRVLDRQSVLLTAERRIGKTTVLKKMKLECPSGTLVFYRDLEGVRTPLEFVQKVVEDVDSSLSARDRAKSRARALMGALAGFEIGPVIKFPAFENQDWKALLDATIADLATFQKQQVLFFWDEIPLMLYNLKARFGEELAMDVLDSLRALRQHHATVRMVFTGSIGLHNVLSSLKRGGYANDPVNDMLTIDMQSLSEADARTLARRLVDGEQLTSADPHALAGHIAEAVDRLPFYIHHVVDSLTERDDHSTATVDAIVEERLADAQDPWHLRHYVERIRTYYEGEAVDVAFAILDHLATAGSAVPFAELRNAVDAQRTGTAKQDVHDTLDLLKRDHYVVQNPRDGTYSFRVPIIRRWWRLHRGI